MYNCIIQLIIIQCLVEFTGCNFYITDIPVAVIIFSLPDLDNNIKHLYMLFTIGNFTLCR